MVEFDKFSKVLRSTFFNGNKEVHTSKNGRVCYIDAYAQNYWSTFFPRLLFAKGLMDSGKIDKVIVLSVCAVRNFVEYVIYWDLKLKIYM
jgi:hypothetical protein